MQKDPGKLPIKKVKAQFKLWCVRPYKDANIYIRQWGDFTFEYIVCYKNEAYVDHMIITPQNGKAKLTKKQLMESFSLILTAAVTTVVTLRGEVVEAKDKELVEQVAQIAVQSTKGK